MNRWYTPFIIGIAVFLLLFITQNNLSQAISMSGGMFLVFFLIYLIIKYNKKSRQ